MNRQGVTRRIFSAIIFIACAWLLIGAALGQTHPTTAPASQPAKPVAIFITGLYSPLDPSKGDNLNAYIAKYWHDKYKLDVATSVYDREGEILKLVPQSGTVILVGHSWGGDECITIAKKISPRPVKLILIDAVPRLNKVFDLPDNVVWSIQIYRTTRSDGKTPITAYISAPIHSAKWPFKNQIYVPKPGAGPDSQASEHGEKVWDGVAADAVKTAMN